MSENKEIETVEDVVAEAPTESVVVEEKPVVEVKVDEKTAKNLEPIQSGAIGSTVTKVPAKPKTDKPVAAKEVKKEDTVALFSKGNIHWDEVGVLLRGYSVVSKTAADKWLTFPNVRVATPEEVAADFASKAGGVI